ISTLWSWFVREPSQTLWDRMRGKAEAEDVEAAVAPAMVPPRAARKPAAVAAPAPAETQPRALVAANPRIVTPQALETLPETTRDKEKGEKADKRVNVKAAAAAAKKEVVAREPENGAKPREIMEAAEKDETEAPKAASSPALPQREAKVD